MGARSWRHEGRLATAGAIKEDIVTENVTIIDIHTHPLVSAKQQVVAWNHTATDYRGKA